MDVLAWSDVGFLALGACIGTLLAIPIIILLNELFFWMMCKKNEYPHEWLVLSVIQDWIRKR